MTNRQLQPGDKVWMIDHYINSVKLVEISVSALATGRVCIKGRAGDFSLSLFFDSEDEAKAGLIARAESSVTKAKKALQASERSLATLRRKLRVTA